MNHRRIRSSGLCKSGKSSYDSSKTYTIFASLFFETAVPCRVWHLNTWFCSKANHSCIVGYKTAWIS